MQLPEVNADQLIDQRYYAGIHNRFPGKVSIIFVDVENGWTDEDRVLFFPGDEVPSAPSEWQLWGPIPEFELEVRGD